MEVILVPDLRFIKGSDLEASGWPTHDNCLRQGPVAYPDLDGSEGRLLSA